MFWVIFDMRLGVRMFGVFSIFSFDFGGGS